MRGVQNVLVLSKFSISRWAIETSVVNFLELLKKSGSIFVNFRLDTTFGDRDRDREQRFTMV